MNVPSSRSPCVSLPPRVRSTRSARAAARSTIDFRSQFRITGTTRPWGTATAIPMFAVGKTWTSVPAKWAFMSRWRISAIAQALVRMSEKVGRGAPSSVRSTRSSRRRMAASMSAVIAIWKCGVSQASVMRRAIVFRMLESWTTSTSALAGASAAQPGWAAARSTSSATMRPSGPVPLRLESSSPRSFASRRSAARPSPAAPRLAVARRARPFPPSRACRPSLYVLRARAPARLRASEPDRPLPSARLPPPRERPRPRSESPSSEESSDSEEMSSPSSPITATGFPTSISSPSPARIFKTTPEASASTS